ncbi:hypothetical protein RRG08_022156 [Elysia crispata]|uniref:Uncharacterized protein n=1 Tax=Elysia crispata TaxID=231223 RepID=A0AAE1AHR1_9GAST|nr:hypothetical protein RRG08_022156 [Elysia crispata]
MRYGLGLFTNIFSPKTQAWHGRELTSKDNKRKDFVVSLISAVTNDLSPTFSSQGLEQKFLTFPEDVLGKLSFFTHVRSAAARSPSLFLKRPPA